VGRRRKQKQKQAVSGKRQKRQIRQCKSVLKKYRRLDVCGFAWVTPKAAQPMTMTMVMMMMMSAPARKPSQNKRKQQAGG